MIKNKEFRWFFIIQCLLLVAGFLCIKRNVTKPEVVFLGVAIVLITSNIGFSRYRYMKMSQLTEYLVRIQNGETLDIRDNTEGELSILKNEIYKLSLKLNTQAELLLKDKTYLADSLSDISHQMKTPLTSMLMMVDFLEDEELSPEKRKEFIGNLTIGLERMDWLVQALLKLSKLDANAVVFKIEAVEVHTVLSRSVKPLRVPMEVKGVTLSMEQVPSSFYIKGDMKWLSEAFTNIIKNCMEHTAAGGSITIRSEQNNFYTKIVIEDTGVGIDKEDLPHIFERFYKGKNSGSDSVGIGLALAKQIIIRQNGTIEVSSLVGEGTRFEIRIYQ